MQHETHSISRTFPFFTLGFTQRERKGRAIEVGDAAALHYRRSYSVARGSRAATAWGETASRRDPSGGAYGALTHDRGWDARPWLGFG
ncbi:type II secretion system F family protein [Sesbania bispinosa]|nr:type II secretion system F family protein [Sesbania bispinosa]